MVFLKVEPKWNNLRNEPRFAFNLSQAQANLLHQVGSVARRRAQYPIVSRSC